MGNFQVVILPFNGVMWLHYINQRDSMGCIRKYGNISVL